MAMDLSNFKLLKESPDSYEIGHPSGRKLTVEKKGLSDKAHKAIKMYADGGEVTGDASNAIDTLVNNDHGADQASSSMQNAAPQPAVQDTASTAPASVPQGSAGSEVGPNA